MYNDCGMNEDKRYEIQFNHNWTHIKNVYRVIINGPYNEYPNWYLSWDLSATNVNSMKNIIHKHLLENTCVFMCLLPFRIVWHFPKTTILLSVE